MYVPVNPTVGLARLVEVICCEITMTRVHALSITAGLLLDPRGTSAYPFGPGVNCLYPDRPYGDPDHW
jgi:hypothetical protein